MCDNNHVSPLGQTFKIVRRVQSPSTQSLLHQRLRIDRFGNPVHRVLAADIYAVMASKLQPRGPSIRTPSRRPKLMRASATCPQLATSNASRKDLASRQSCGAATILTRVASYSAVRQEHSMTASPHSSYSSPDPRSPESASLDARKEPFEIVIQRCE
jgi:hypothetical protein